MTTKHESDLNGPMPSSQDIERRDRERFNRMNEAWADRDEQARNKCVQATTRPLYYLSREAQLVALTHFISGRGNEVFFSNQKHAQLNPRWMSGMGDLIADGMVKVTKSKMGVTYTSLERIGVPLRDIQGMREDEAYPLFTKETGNG